MDPIREAVGILRSGGLVAFPTETVYGLGADATNPQAVQRIFAAKGRPSTNPVIVHVANELVARRYAAVWPDAASELARRFWPGPLTLVVQKTGAICPEVSAGLETVGLRAPDHPLALELLRAFDGPVAAPSANPSTRLSPTTAQHVRDELGDRVDLILDGGPCRVGIESTVLDVASVVPRILRPGQVTRQQIEAVIGPVTLLKEHDGGTSAPSPGLLAVHYAPHTPTFRFESWQGGQVPQRSDAGVILRNDSAELRRQGTLVRMPNTPDAYARELYGVLRDLDRLRLAALYVELPPNEPAWLAIRDRLVRASSPLPG